MPSARSSLGVRRLAPANWSLLLVLASCAAEASSDAAPVETRATDAPDTVVVQFDTEQDIEAFFEEIDYAPRHWAAGVREVPRMYVTEVSEAWRRRSRDELTVQAKKRIFFRAMAPLALRSNELIRAEREALLGLPASDALDPSQRDKVAELADQYGLDAPGAEDGPESWDALRDELEVRVDEVPVSLVLAQAANESGWGTSRFATEGNSLFGQWSFGGSGMLPEDQRASLGDYRVAAFESPLLSVIAYMRNLNTHDAYTSLRALRARAREAGNVPRGHDLAGGLDRYSERGQDYVDEVRSIIDFNSLQDTDLTYLADGPVYLVMPAGEGGA